MDINLIKKPHEVSFSGNPMGFSFALSPYSLREQAVNYAVLITVFIEKVYDNNAFEIVKSQTYYPSKEGIVNFDVRSLIDPFLEYYTPRPDLTVPTVCENQTKRYKLSYGILKDGIPVGDAINTDILYAMKGGMSYNEWLPKQFFEQAISNRWFLSFFADSEKKVMKSEPRFLFYFQKNTNPYNLQYVLSDDNGTTQTVTFTYKSLSSVYDFLIVYDRANSAASWSSGVSVGMNVPLVISGVASGVDVQFKIEFHKSVGGLQETIYTTDIVDGGSLDVMIELYLNDGTTTTNLGSPTPPLKSYQVGCIPVGYDQMDLQSMVPSGKQVVKYSILLKQNLRLPNRVIVNEFFFDIDYRNFYDPFTLLYRNSLGGLETVTLKGQVDFEADYEKESATRTVAPSYYSNLLLDAQTIKSGGEETEKYKGDTGFINKEAVQRLRDIFLMQEVYEMLGEKLVPISILQKNLKFYSNKESMLSLQIEWQRAYTNSYFTPAGLLEMPSTCPALETLVAIQMNKNTLQVMYGLVMPYDRVHIQILYQVNGETRDYYFNGNSGTQFIKFALPSMLIYPQSVYVRARTVCNELTGDYGPWKIVDLYVYENQLPIAVDDTYNIAAGFTSSQTLPGSVLDNDYDPDGDAIEVIAVTSATTTAGGVYSINAAGIVSYTPPSAAYAGQDSFVYIIQKVGGSTSVPALVKIIVGMGYKTIFVRLSQLNIVQTTWGSTFATGGYHGSRRCEYWLHFYEDVAGTRPTSVTGLGIVINTQKKVTTQVNDSTTGVVTTSPTFTGNSTGMKIFDDEFFHFNIGAGIAKTVVFTEISLLGGAGYVPIP
jgi:hypothetical protein